MLAESGVEEAGFVGRVLEDWPGEAWLEAAWGLLEAKRSWAGRGWG